MNRWLTFGIATCLTVSSLLVGCAPTAVPSVDSAEDTAAKTKVIWWQAPVEPAIADVIQETFVDVFNAEHPNIELEVVFMEDYYRTTQTAIQAGAGPDIIQLGGPAYAIEYWAADQIVDLTDFAEQYGWGEKLLPWAYESGKSGDALISLPFMYESMLLFYNKTVLEELGMEPPTNLGELEAICSAAEETERWCFSHFFARNRFYFSTVWGSYVGADVFREAVIQERQWDDPLFVQAEELQKSWVDRGWVSDDLATYYSLTGDDAWSNLAEGLAVFQIVGTWGFRSASSYFDEAGQEWDWVMVPSLREGVDQVYDLSVGESLAINAGSEHPEAAAEVLDFIFSHKDITANIAEAAQFGYWLVPLEFSTSDFSGNVDPRMLRFFEDFTAKTGDGKIGYTIWTYWPPQAKTWAEQEEARVFNNEWTVEQFLAGFQEQYAAEYSGATMPLPPEPNVSSPQ